MQTRSQTKRLQLDVQLDVQIDFDFASKCWRSNKKYIGNGCYQYICQGKTKKGLSCKRKCIHNEIYCKNHLSNISAY